MGDCSTLQVFQDNSDFTLPGRDSFAAALRFCSVGINFTRFHTTTFQRTWLRQTMSERPRLSKIMSSFRQSREENSATRVEIDVLYEAHTRRSASAASNDRVTTAMGHGSQDFKSPMPVDDMIDSSAGTGTARRRLDPFPGPGERENYMEGIFDHPVMKTHPT